ncbi:PRTRC system protein B, partial [Bacteroides xylanisolvens]|uniref:PRTRC system protein B n=2 Tax=Bacteroides TaxID=816 RepID=UPI0032C19886
SYTEGMNGTPHGRIPPNMLLCDPRKGHEKYIWYNPPQKRKMYFQSCLHITDGTFNVPGIIYVVEQESMDVHAFKGTVPQEQTELYLAPFFNVTGADVCLGNSSLEKPLDTDFSGFQEYWEKRFWLSEFSHLGGSRNPTRSNLVSVTEKARENPFDYSELKPSGKKLKDILL